MSKRKKSIPFVVLFRDVLSSDKWKELTVYEQVIYIELKSRYNGGNEKEIVLPYSYFKGRISHNAVWRAFKGLESKGWIEREHRGGLFRYKNIFSLTLRYDRLLNKPSPMAIYK